MGSIEAQAVKGRRVRLFVQINHYIRQPNSFHRSNAAYTSPYNLPLLIAPLSPCLLAQLRPSLLNSNTFLLFRERRADLARQETTRP